MATTIVCPMTLHLKLSTPKPHHSLELSFKPKQPEGGWSFLQALSPTPKNNDEKEVYVHPPVKRVLSDESLAMCTESLCTENGSHDMVADFDALLSMSKPSTGQKRTKQSCIPRNYPPPLTTMRGSECLRIKPIREGGKMVMEAVMGPSTRTCFRSERTHGRIRLYYSPPQQDHNEETEHAVEDQEVGGGGLDMNGNNLKFGGKMVIEESHSHHRTWRCIQGEIGNRKSLNWEPFWVATS